MTRTIRNILVVFGLVSLCLLSRLIFFAPYLEDWDGVDFALALRHYDLSTYQPHFPGYPVYIALGHLVCQFVSSEPSALILTNIIFSSLTILPLMALTQFIFSETVAFMAGLLYLTNPFCWLEAGKALADPTGLFFIFTALYFLTRAACGTGKYHLFVGGLFLGLSWGVRLDYFPFFVSLVYASYHTKQGHSFRGYSGFFLGILFWLLPQISIGGEKEFWIEARAFIMGHFNSWGGSIYSQPNLPERGKDFFWGYYANGLGGWWPDTPEYRLLTSAILFGSMIYFSYWIYKGYWSKDKKKKIIPISLISYCLWVFLGQNLANPRHVLPAISLTFILLAGAWQRCRTQFKGKKLAPLPSFCLVALIGFWALEAIRLNLIRYTQPPPQLQAVQYVKDCFPEHFTRIYCQETKRLFDYYAPYYQVKRVRNFSQLERDLQGAYPQMSPVLLVTSRNGEEVGIGKLNLLQVFQNNRYIYYPGHHWYLYNVRIPLENKTKDH